MDPDELNLQILKVVIIELKLTLEGPIGDPLPLAQEVTDLVLGLDHQVGILDPDVHRLDRARV